VAKRVAIVQSCYIPWKGYFDLINLCDEFILYDDVQYTRRDWRNRNVIKTRAGVQWLTIPIDVKGRYHQRVCDAVAQDDAWRTQHWRSLLANYARAAHFPDYASALEDLYLHCDERLLSTINHRFLSAICGWLGIDTRVTWSMDYSCEPGLRKTERLIALCQRAGAGQYLSGPAARAYIDEDAFRRAGIELQYMDYSGYSEHSQQFPPFVHEVSVLDLLFNEGTQAPRFMKSFPSVSIGAPIPA
jgi:hypothetical protein